LRKTFERKTLLEAIRRAIKFDPRQSNPGESSDDDEKWRDDALAFTAKGFRPTAIAFFPPLHLNEARIWLNA
jgi:hypothetical protein